MDSSEVEGVEEERERDAKEGGEVENGFDCDGLTLRSLDARERISSSDTGVILGGGIVAAQSRSSSAPARFASECMHRLEILTLTRTINDSGHSSSSQPSLLSHIGNSTT